MEVDWDHLLQVELAPDPLTIIRFYGWERPTVSLGKHQRLEKAIDSLYCKENCIPVVQRPTGGRAVFHADEITYAVASNDPSLFPLQSIIKTYAAIALALQRGLEIMKIETQLSPGRLSQTSFPSFGHQKPCFTTSSRYELHCQDRKLAGSAQRRLKRSFLQHGSMALNIDYGEMARVLGCSEKLLKQSTISLSEAAQQSIHFGQAANFLKAGFEKVLSSSSG